MIRYKLTFAITQSEFVQPQGGEWELYKMSSHGDRVWFLWREVLPESRYSYQVVGEEPGSVFVKFAGPGIFNEDTVRVAAEHNAETICRWLNRAISKGKDNRSSELRSLLGAQG